MKDYLKIFKEEFEKDIEDVMDKLDKDMNSGKATTAAIAKAMALRKYIKEKTDLVYRLKNEEQNTISQEG